MVKLFFTSANVGERKEAKKWEECSIHSSPFGGGELPTHVAGGLDLLSSIQIVFKNCAHIESCGENVSAPSRWGSCWELETRDLEKGHCTRVGEPYDPASPTDPDLGIHNNTRARWPFYPSRVSQIGGRVLDETLSKGEIVSHAEE
ncbi:hypothetical protein TNCT_26181 [Trichonephila clavata]|uniref:Uncharacterized protein n=1 Tax=Trichonephila clavata TaxID=2740835 RepID=A0A8X6KYN3_TRICU|nr:hypothetical protein TNCT_26181 [Trichonephila clavata]